MEWRLFLQFSQPVVQSGHCFYLRRVARHSRHCPTASAEPPLRNTRQTQAQALPRREPCMSVPDVENPWGSIWECAGLQQALAISVTTSAHQHG
eukprot:13921042-Alexandrium_andersonii.AAC.1